jgi:hypothetical protein
MTRRSRRRSIDAHGFAALAAFARGYLHEDVIAEHGDAATAAAAFHADASDEERRQLADDLERLSEAAHEWTEARLSRFFARELGAAWTPGSVSEVRALGAIARTGDPARRSK